MPHLLYCADYPELQKQFISEVTSLKQANPLAPLTVLVTGQLVRLSLARELVRAGTNHVNIRFLTLNELAHELALRDLASSGLHSLPDLLGDVIMEQAVLNAAHNVQYFGKLLGRAGFRDALWRTINELRGAGLTHRHLAESLNRQPIRNNLTLQKKLGDLALIWRELDAILRKHKFADPISRLELALQGSQTDTIASPLLVYGLDNLNALEANLLSRLFDTRDVLAFLAFQPEDDYQWAEPVYRWYFEQNFEIEYLDSSPEHSTLLLSAPGESRESEEIVREILYSPLAQSKPDRSSAVLFRQNDPYVDLFREALSRAGALGYFHQCRTLGSTHAGRALYRLIRLLDGKFRRDRVMDFLLSAPLNTAEWFPAELPSVPVAEWNYFTLTAQIVEGEKSWNEQLAKLVLTLEREWDNDDDEDQSNPERLRRVASVNLLREYARRLFEDLQKIATAPSFLKMGELLWNCFADRIRLEEDAEQISDELEKLSLLDDIGVPANLKTFQQLLARILETPAGRESRFEHHQPTVATLQQATGVIFDEILIPGLVERRFPQPTSQDPLLLDDERVALNRALSFPEDAFAIPLRGKARLQEIYLFRVMTNSARARLVLSYPRIGSGGRETLPSVFLLRTLEAVTGAHADYESLDHAFRSAAFARRIPMNRVRAASAKTAVTSLDFDLAKLHQALESKDGRVLAYLKSRQFFSRALESERRYHRREFTRYEGFVEDSDLQKQVSAWCEKHLVSVSPTRLESYARCPFQYFGLHFLDLRKMEEPQAVASIEPLERGSLWHRILERFYRQEHRANRLPLTKESLPRLLACADEILSLYEQDEITGLYMLWQQDKRRMLAALEKWFGCELADFDRTKLLPEVFEQRYEFSINIIENAVVHFGGRIDRIDRSSDGRVRVVDYKTGKKDETKKDGGISGGRALQLPIYRLAAESMLKQSVERAEYFFTSDKGGWKRVAYTDADWSNGRALFEKTVFNILDGLRSGKFYPYPDKQCDACEVRDACGQGRLTRKWSSALDQTAAFREMREAEA